MGAKRLPMRKLREILRLKYELRMRHRAIARACGVGVGTVSEHVARAREAGLSWPLPNDLDDATLEARLFATAEPKRERIAPDVMRIHQELKRTGVTLQLLWEEYLGVHPEGYRYSQFCEIYRRWAKRLKPSMRQVHRAGEKTFIDFSGKRPHIVDRRTGEEIPVELFVAVLGASSFTYAEATESQQLPCWVGAHTRMADYFEGSTEIWVPDQLKSGVTRACRYEPGIHRTYQELAEHYGAVVIPARPGKPRDKPKVESGVLVAQRWILARLRDQTFFSIPELNQAIWKLLEEVNDRPMQKLRVSRRQLYEQLDRPALKPLPTQRFEIADWKWCTVNVDYHVEVDHHYYSVQHPLRGERVEARFTNSTVEIIYKGKRITSHRRSYERGRHTTKPEHMPSSHRAHAEWTPSRLIRWAEKAGPATGRVVAEILRSRPHPEQGYRACLGIMRLGRSYGTERLEAASRRAEQLRSASYRTVRNILSSNQDRLPFEELETRATPPTPVHANIRGASYYAAAEEEIEC
jgi:transposase